MNEDCVCPTVLAGGCGITILGAFHAGGKCDLHVLDGNLNQHKCFEIWDKKLLPFARATFQNNFVFQDDNAPAHRARTITNNLEQQGVEHLEWPAVSPDMNPIENVWAEMTHYMNNLDVGPTNLLELRQVIDDAWHNIAVQTLASLVKSMPRRLETLRQSRRGYTKY